MRWSRCLRPVARWDGGTVDAFQPLPTIRQTVLDTTDSRGLAEFYRQLLGMTYRSDCEPPPAGEPDPNGADWLVLRSPDSAVTLAFQQVGELPEVTWPSGPVPQQMHLDLTVTTMANLDAQHHRVLDLGGRLIEDRSDDPTEPLRIYADPGGHPFCVFMDDSAS